MGTRTPPLRDSTSDVVGGAGLRPAASGESERRVHPTLLDREGMRVLSFFCRRGFAGEGRPRGTSSRRPSGSFLRLPAFTPFPEGPGREEGPRLSISLEPSFPPNPICLARLPDVPFHQAVASRLGKSTPLGSRRRVSDLGPTTPVLKSPQAPVFPTVFLPCLT